MRRVPRKQWVARQSLFTYNSDHYCKTKTYITAFGFLVGLFCGFSTESGVFWNGLFAADNLRYRNPIDCLQFCNRQCWQIFLFARQRPFARAVLRKNLHSPAEGILLDAENRYLGYLHNAMSPYCTGPPKEWQ